MNNLELEKRVADLEKRVMFLYKSLAQQLEINRKLIDDAKSTTDHLINFSNAIENNSLSIGMLSEMIKQEQES